MPVAYPIPPWIAQGAAPNPAEAYISNLRLGVQIGQERDRLQQQQQLAMMETQARAQEQAQRNLLEQQRIEYERAYQNEELGLQQAKLDEAKQLNDVKIQEASQRFAAQQRVQQAIASGKSPAEAMFAEAANLDLGAGDIGALSRAVKAPAAIRPELTDLGDQGYAMRTGPNSYKHIPKAAVPGAVQAQPVLPPGGGKPLSGLIAVPGPGGRMTVRSTGQTGSAADRPARLHRQIIARKRAALQKVLDNEGLMAQAVARAIRQDPKMKDPEETVRDRIEKQIDQLDQEYEQTGGNGGDEGGAPDLIFDPQTRKFVKPTASTGTGDPQQDLALNEDQQPEQSDEDEEEA